MSFMTLSTMAELGEELGYLSRWNTAEQHLEFHDERNITTEKSWSYVSFQQFAQMVLARKLDSSLSKLEAKRLAEGTVLNQIEDKTQ